MCAAFPKLSGELPPCYNVNKYDPAVLNHPLYQLCEQAVSEKSCDQQKRTCLDGAGGRGGPTAAQCLQRFRNCEASCP